MDCIIGAASFHPPSAIRHPPSLPAAPSQFSSPLVLFRDGEEATLRVRADASMGDRRGDDRAAGLLAGAGVPGDQARVLRSGAAGARADAPADRDARSGYARRLEAPEQVGS